MIFSSYLPWFFMLTFLPDAMTLNLLEPFVTALQAKAVIKVEGKDFVTVTFLQNLTLGAPVQVTVNSPLTGAKKTGEFAMHVHRWGNMTQQCLSMGPHFNPDLVFHGGQMGYIRHVGDLGNIYVGTFSEGKGTAVKLGSSFKRKFPKLIELLSPKLSKDKQSVEYTFTDNRISLMGRNSIIGRGLVVHAKPDDFGKGGTNASLENGNAGDPIGCEVIGRLAPVKMDSPLLSNTQNTQGAAVAKTAKQVVLLDDASLKLPKNNRPLVSLITKQDSMEPLAIEPKQNAISKVDKIENKNSEIDDPMTTNSKSAKRRKDNPLNNAGSEKRRNGGKSIDLTSEMAISTESSEASPDNSEKSVSQESSETNINNLSSKKGTRRRKQQKHQKLSSGSGLTKRQSKELNGLVQLLVANWGEQVAAEMLLEAFGSEQLDLLIGGS